MKEYTISSQACRKIVILTDIHLCDKLWNRTPCEERMELLQKVMNQEYREHPFDAILCLGDYSLDFWCWETMGSYLNTPSVSNTKNFIDKVLPGLPLRPYLIPGNHEQYGNEKWQEITGFPRQFSLVYGDYVFLMCDTFGGDLDPAEHSDGTYTGLDPVFLREVMEKHPDKQLILCMHDLIPEKESREVMELVGGSGRFLCGFAGHIHQSRTVILPPQWGSLPLVYCGDFSYTLGSEADALPNWGFQRVDFSSGFTTSYQPCLQLASCADWRKAHRDQF